MQKQKPKPENILSICFQTWLVCLIGLFISLMLGLSFSVSDLIKTIFPILGHGYWFVTDYILLLILAPYLNRFIETLEKDRLYIFTIIIFFSFSLMTMLPGRFGWKGNYSGITLFILLYFIQACLRETKVMHHRVGGGIVYLVSSIMLFCTYYVLKVVLHKSDEISAYFYAYRNPLIILQAVSLFQFVRWHFINKEMGKSIYKALIASSLFTYLYHMHPIIKTHYVDMELLHYMDYAKPVLLIAELLASAILILLGGVCIGYPCIKLSKRLSIICSNKIRNIMLYKKKGR